MTENINFFYAFAANPGFIEIPIQISRLMPVSNNTILSGPLLVILTIKRLDQCYFVTHYYDLVCIFAIFSKLFGIVMAGGVLMKVTRRSNKSSSECQRIREVIVWW